MEYRNDLADVLLNGLPDDERKQVIETISQVDAEKLRRKRAAGDEGVLDITELDTQSEADDEEDEDVVRKPLVPEQG
jgi:hypothetical protein